MEINIGSNGSGFGDGPAWIAIIISLAVLLISIVRPSWERRRIRRNLIGALAQELKLNLATFHDGATNPLDRLTHLSKVHSGITQVRHDLVFTSNVALILELRPELSESLIGTYGRLVTNDEAAMRQVNKFAGNWGNDNVEAVFNSGIFVECCLAAAADCGDTLQLFYAEVNEPIEDEIKKMISDVDALISTGDSN